MEKQKIGKVQLWIGIILLIVGIVGVIVSIFLFNNTNHNLIESVSDIDKTGVIYTFVLFTIESLLGIGSIITIFISLLFITQGLANKSEK